MSGDPEPSARAGRGRATGIAGPGHYRAPPSPPPGAHHGTFCHPSISPSTSALCALRGIPSHQEPSFGGRKASLAASTRACSRSDDKGAVESAAALCTGSGCRDAGVSGCPGLLIGGVRRRRRSPDSTMMLKSLGGTPEPVATRAATGQT